jgi:putative ABC transport system permease protein
MKHVILIWAGLWRNKTRTILTLLSIVAAFLLYGILQSIGQGLSAVYTHLDADRLFVQNSIAMGNSLPLSYLERIRKVAGVRDVTSWTFFGGYYQEPRNGLTVFATDIDSLLKVFPLIRMPPEQRTAAAHVRTALIVSKTTAAKYGWKVGDQVPISSSIWQRKDGGRVYPADVVGIMDLSRYAAFPDAFLAYDYFDATRAQGSGTVHWYIVLLDDPHLATQVASAIDAMFANSASQTSTVNEKLWAQNQLKQVGDVQLITRSIVGAVFFALLFLTVNTMMQSVRERIPELAVLSTLGYSGSRIFTLIALESLTLCLSACLVGLLLANAIFKPLAPIFGEVSLPLPVVLEGVGIAVLLALLCGLPPAWRASKLSVVDALADR